jgi:hypothetical protein
VRRTLHSQGIIACVALKKPLLNEKHWKQRLDFAKAHQHWIAKQWERIVWTDESTFEIGKNFCCVYVWRTEFERHHSECLAPTFKSGRTFVMIWGTFAGN